MQKLCLSKVTCYIKILVVKKICFSLLLVFKHVSVKIIMKQTVSAIPAQCKQCGALFDLSYDLAQISEERLVRELVRATRTPRTFLCWECRTKL